MDFLCLKSVFVNASTIASIAIATQFQNSSRFPNGKFGNDFRALMGKFLAFGIITVQGLCGLLKAFLD